MHYYLFTVLKFSFGGHIEARLGFPTGNGWRCSYTPADYLVKALFTCLVFFSLIEVEISGDLIFTQYPPIPINTLPQKYFTMMKSF
jgi:hypothetical protein